MRMGKERKLDLAQIEFERLPVLAIGLPSTLKQATIDDECTVRMIHLEAGPRHLSSGAVESQLHRQQASLCVLLATPRMHLTRTPQESRSNPQAV